MTYDCDNYPPSVHCWLEGKIACLTSELEQTLATIACHEQGILTLSRTVDGLLKERDALKEKVKTLELGYRGFP